MVHNEVSAQINDIWIEIASLILPFLSQIRKKFSMNDFFLPGQTLRPCRTATKILEIVNHLFYFVPEKRRKLSRRIFGYYSSHVLFNQILRLLPSLGSTEEIAFIVKSVIDGVT